MNQTTGSILPQWVSALIDDARPVRMHIREMATTDSGSVTTTTEITTSSEESP